MRHLLLAIAVLSMCSCVSLFEPHPSRLPNNTAASDDQPLDFGVGDRFETLVPMYLTSWRRKADWTVSIHDTHYNPPYVTEMIPAGTTLTVAGIKRSRPYYMNPMLIYVTFDGSRDWVWSCDIKGEREDRGGIHYTSYNKQYFRKLLASDHREE